MAPLELDGDNLGKKHQHYNKLLKQAIRNQETTFTVNIKGKGDIENLLNIDLACVHKDVEFIFNVFKCDDMLYVSRAVKRSTWLITDPCYAHMINIDYLKTYLFPYMTTKAIHKLMLSIRIHIKDEKRAEGFFDYEEKKNVSMALKWLPHCSLPFIEHAIEKHRDAVSADLLKRLCEKSINVLEVYIKNKEYIYADSLTPTLFLINNDAERYLNIVAELGFYQIPNFGRKYTEILMKRCPEKILDNFEKFWNHIDYIICVKNMKTEDIKPFLLKQAKNENMRQFLKYENVKHFLHRIPKKERFEFVKQMFINIEKSEKHAYEEEDGVFMTADVSCGWTNSKNVYNWYRFAPFDVAFCELKNLIRTESSPEERNSMLTILLYCAGSNIKNIHTLLKYYYEKHINEPFKFKIKFMEKLLKNVHIIKHSDTWSIINRLFHSMEVYVESNNNVQKCIEILIINNAVHNEPNSKVIEDKFSFTTLKAYKKNLQPDEREKVFRYLYSHLEDKINNKAITSEICFNEVVKMMKTFLDLLNDWDKKLNDYPTIMNKIKELIAIKREKSWNSKLSSLYHVNKTWRKYMFEESILLSPSETVCLNALKHDSSLLLRYEDEIHKLSCKDTVSLRILLNKLRVYWPLSLTAQWTNFYLQQLDNPGKHKAVIKALMIILPADELKNFITKHAPEDTKINWGDIDEVQLSLRKCVAKKMYLSRPSLPAEMILLYAKGDYLQYAVPSLSAMLSNLCSNQSRPIVQKLLTAPVSLQKYGIRLAFSKLAPKELKPLFSEAWQSTTNPTIRAVLFEKTHHALCIKANTEIADEMWELLSEFIDHLSHKENKKIYNLLGDIKKVPLSVRGKFYKKSYTFLGSMPADDFIENILARLINIMVQSHIMDQLDTEFVADVMLKGVDETFGKSKCKFINVISTSVLHCNDEDTQTERYERILAPLMDRYLPLWDTKHDNKKFVRHNMENLLKALTSNLQNVFLDRDKVIPFKMFKDILNKLENSLSVKENYVLITNWKLVTAFTELVNVQRTSLPHVEEKDCLETRMSYNRRKAVKEKWDEFIIAIIPSFAKVCTDNLRTDIAKYFPSIYLLYGQAVYDILSNFDQYYLQYLLFKHMLSVDKSNENYLLVINYCSIFPLDDQKEILDEIRALLESHASDEIQMHCHDKFNVLDISNI